MRRLENLSWSEALRCAKKGFAIQRVRWKGKRMFVSVFPEKTVSASTFMVGSVWDEYFHGKTEVKKSAYLAMKSTDDKIVRGWLPSQDDMLSNDWQVIDPVSFFPLEKGVADE